MPKNYKFYQTQPIDLFIGWTIENVRIMKVFKINEICCLFCCPPCPGPIASKLAFLPPISTYEIIETETSGICKLKFNDRAEWHLQCTSTDLALIEPFYETTTRGYRIACGYIRCVPFPRFTILFSHSNALDLGQLLPFLLILGRRLNCNVLGYDYAGYGCSEARPSERNMYADIDAAWRVLRSKYKLDPKNILLYGQSIGTVPTVDLASRNEVAGVVLHAALTSGIRVAFPSTKRTWFFDAFPNIDKCPKISSPVLVIHGSKDDIIDFSHGMAIFQKCPAAVAPLWIDGAGHNDLEMYISFWQRLENFVKRELTPPLKL